MKPEGWTGSARHVVRIVCWVPWACAAGGIVLGCVAAEKPELPSAEREIAATGDRPAQPPASPLQPTEGAALGSSPGVAEPIEAAGSGAPPDTTPDAPAADAAPPVPACVPKANAATTSAVACAGYTASTYNAPTVCGSELHFVSVYEASSDHSRSYPASVAFNAKRAGAVLVLSSYEAVDWSVSVGPSSSLGKIIVLGYKASTVAAPAGVVIENRSPLSKPYKCNYGVTPSDPCVDPIEALTGGSVASMHGCYNGTSFVLN